MTPGKRTMDCGRRAGGGRRLRPCGLMPSRCMWPAAWALLWPGRMLGLTGTGGGRQMRAARKPMPLPSPGQLPRPPPALQQFLEGSTTRPDGCGPHLSVCRSAILLLHGAAVIIFGTTVGQCCDFRDSRAPRRRAEIWPVDGNIWSAYPIKYGEPSVVRQKSC